MKEHCTIQAARSLALSAAEAIEAERLPLPDCAGRVLAEDMAAALDVPPFDRSPYDGYALRGMDTAHQARCFQVLEALSAGQMPRCTVTEGTAVKVSTGAPIPPGADAVVPYERTAGGPEAVRLLGPVPAGANVVRAGEDIQRGTMLARQGTVIDPPLLGVLASQGLAAVPVYRRPRVALISTGGELTEAGEPLLPGKIYNASRYTLSAALMDLGCIPIWLGQAEDRTEEIAALLEQGLADCDAVVLTGGVSVGEQDRTPAAMQQAGVAFLFQRVACKPGMACAYGVRRGKLVCGLSGNPVSALTNFYMIAAPALRKLGGRRDVLPESIPVTLQDPFPKASPVARLLWGQLDLSEGRTLLRLSSGQGNVILSGAVGCRVLAEVPANSGALAAGTVLRGWRL